MGFLDFISRGRRQELELVESKALPEDADVIGFRNVELGQRVYPSWLEALYARDADVYAAINHRVKTFMSSGYSIQADSDKVKVWFEKWLADVSFSVILQDLVLNAGVFGNAWIELVYNANKTKMVGLDHLDPKIMDFGRDSNEYIMYDKYNNPLYYVQSIPEGRIVPEDKESRLVTQSSPRLLEGTGNGLKLEQDEIAHFTLNTPGDTIDGIGWIEPCYNAVISKCQIEKDWAMAMKKAASPILVGTSGDEKHRPTPTITDKFLEEMKKSKSTSVMSLPYYNKVEFVGADIPSLEPNLSYYVDKISAATGVPKPYITGSGDKTPRSTFKGLNLGYERDTKQLQAKIAYDVRVQIFTRLSDQQGFKEVPYLVFEPPSIEYMDSKADRLIGYASAGLLVPDKVTRNLIRSWESLPDEPESVPDIIETKPKETEKLDGEDPKQ